MHVMLCYIFSIMFILFFFLPFSDQLHVLIEKNHSYYHEYYIDSKAKEGDKLLTKSEFIDCNFRNIEFYQLPNLGHSNFDSFINNNKYICENSYLSTEYSDYIHNVSEFFILHLKLVDCFPSSVKENLDHCISKNADLKHINICLNEKVKTPDRIKFNSCIYKFLEDTKQFRKNDEAFKDDDEKTKENNTTGKNPDIKIQDRQTLIVIQNSLNEKYSKSNTHFLLIQQFYNDIFSDKEPKIRVTDEDKENCYSLITKVTNSDFETKMFTLKVFDFLNQSITNVQPNINDRNQFAMNEKTLFTFFNSIDGKKNERLFLFYILNPITLEELKIIRQIIPIQNEDYSTYLLRTITNSKFMPLTIKLWKEDYDDLYPSDTMFSKMEVTKILAKREEIRLVIT